ncbi:hypothetical protein J6590_003776 [Homalodisca vitripennis]|nr:hypothetical protein J6590_003776 [Homalodisca vitripennis]
MIGSLLKVFSTDDDISALEQNSSSLCLEAARLLWELCSRRRRSRRRRRRDEMEGRCSEPRRSISQWIGWGTKTERRNRVPLQKKEMHGIVVE